MLTPERTIVNPTLSPEITIPDLDHFHLGTPQATPGRRAAVAFWAGLGCKFVLLRPNDKAPIGRGWQDRPADARAALRWSGNLGIAAGKHSSNIVFLDLDTRAREFLAMFPALANSLVIWRDDAPDRVKIAVRITDRLPRSANWRQNPQQPQPDIELLSTGRQAFVMGLHPSGAILRNNGKKPAELAFGDLSAIWRRWSGTELPDPTAPKTRTLTDAHRAIQAATPHHSDNVLAQRVRALWTVLDVFGHHGIGGEHREEGAGQIRLLGNGGLLVDVAGDLWYQFSGAVGGDAISAWAWVTRGVTQLSPALFVAVCREMLIARGEPWADRPRLDWDRLAEHYAQPGAYPSGRRNSHDRGAMLAILDRMRAAGRPMIKLSSRELGEMMGSTHNTAASTLRRLCGYGLIQRVHNAPSWHTGEVHEPIDGDLINQFDAYAYQLSEQALRGAGVLSKLDTEQSSSGLALRTVTVSDSSADDSAAGIDLDPHTLAAWADNDAFQWGARVAGMGEDARPVRLGRAALDVIAALVVANDLDTGAIAGSTGRSRSGLSPVLNSLADLGIVERYREGRSLFWYLREGWRDILQRYLSALTTYCRTIKRRIAHLRQRLDRAGAALGLADSGRLRAAICELLDRWRRRLDLLRDELNRLQALIAA